MRSSQRRFADWDEKSKEIIPSDWSDISKGRIKKGKGAPYF